MAYSYHNGYCRQCGEFVPKGPDTSKRLFVNADERGPKGWDIFCLPCAAARQNNKNKAASKRAYIKRQPTLFD